MLKRRLEGSNTDVTEKKKKMKTLGIFLKCNQGHSIIYFVLFHAFLCSAKMHGLCFAGLTKVGSDISLFLFFLIL